jgi:hypothetical protein
MIKLRLALFSRILFILLAILLVGYLLVRKVEPLGVSAQYSTDNPQQQITLIPPDRLFENLDSYGQKTSIIKTDFVYFETLFPYYYDTAKVKMTLQNLQENQSVYLGFQDQEKWHYETELMDMPLLNILQKEGWNYVGSSPAVYQKDNHYSSFREFLTEPPQGVTAVFNYDKNSFRQDYIPDYNPSDQNTIINTPLRGNVVFYTYLNNELFKLNVAKQDLNTYEDPDVVSIKIYKENDVVYSAQIDDDGIIDNSGVVLAPSEVFIQNPGPELPEPGVYKVVINAPSDTVITRLTTNLHKLVFASPIFLASNHEVYPKIVEKTEPNKIFSDALGFTFQTYHLEGRQLLKIGTESAQLNLKEELFATPSATATESSQLTEIEIPKSDVVVKGKLGYFAFSPDQFFQPTRYKLQSIENREDLKGVDYIIADYTPSRQEGEWRVAEAEFDLKTAVIKNGKLSWLIKAPGLEESGNEIVIKKIEIELVKKPLIKF